jgi:hypothetical protein
MSPLPSGSFDLAISGCGPALWCDPARRVLYGVPGDTGSAQFAALMRIAAVTATNLQQTPQVQRIPASLTRNLTCR